MSSEYMTASERGHSRYTLLSSEENSSVNSASPSRPSSPVGNAPPKGRKGVRFNNTSEANDTTNQKSSLPLRDDSVSPSPQPPMPLRNTKPSPAHSRNGSAASVLRRTPDQESKNPFEDSAINPVFKPKPSVLKRSGQNTEIEVEDEHQYNESAALSALAAQGRAQRIASLVGSRSAPTSRRNSLDEGGGDAFLAERPRREDEYTVGLTGIPLVDFDTDRTYDGAVIDSEEEEFNEKAKRKGKASSSSEAHKLVRQHTRKGQSEALAIPADLPGLPSGATTPIEEHHEEYVPPPAQYRGGVLSSLLKLYNAPHSSNSRRSSISSTGSPSNFESRRPSAASSGTSTPKTKHAKWYHQKNHSQDTLAGLIGASAVLGAPGGAPKTRQTRPGLGKRPLSATFLNTGMYKMNKGPRLEDEIRITVHIAEILSRQKYLLRLCRALMTYGAPTHRLEEYMKMSARVLEIEGQFLYIPGCMIISFDDASTHTTEVKIVKAPQGVNLGKLKDVWEIYKEVVHDVIGVEEATQRLDNIIQAERKYPIWVLVIAYGFASASVGPFAFDARMIDLPIAFILGCILGMLQLVLAPKSEMYSNVFEISATVATSFLARAFGSIRGGNLFCFSALAQSSIALILPGYMVLCGSLELQSKSMVAGSVRLVYAIIYSLFLGFGMTIGIALYGLFDEDAVSSTTCQNPMNEYYGMIFVPVFAFCLCIINQAKWKQIPMMTFIAAAGHVANWGAEKKFPSSQQISNTIGAFAIGLIANVYSRVRHGVAAAALLPAIFVQVPSGLASSGSLLTGVSSADQITNATVNGTTTSTSTSSTDGYGNSLSLTFGYNMIQIAIGITVGLFFSALVVYPLGKKRSGLFSF